MHYYQLTIEVSSADALALLMADLDGLPVETVHYPQGEEGRVAEAYIPENLYREMTEQDFPLAGSLGEVRWTTTWVEHQNWNALWESNFEPLEVDDTLLIRAPFHAPPIPGRFAYEIIMEPKMAFGTGHHATTYLMCRWLLERDLTGKTVLDMGCGTAVLALVAKYRGASFVEGVDIDPWAIDNAKEIVRDNGFSEIPLWVGDGQWIQSQSLEGKRFDILLANIQRNILIQDMLIYASVLSPSGRLVVSGFFTEDQSVIQTEAMRCGLQWAGSEIKDKWCRMEFLQPGT